MDSPFTAAITAFRFVITLGVNAEYALADSISSYQLPNTLTVSFDLIRPIFTDGWWLVGGGLLLMGVGVGVGVGVCRDGDGGSCRALRRSLQLDRLHLFTFGEGGLARAAQTIYHVMQIKRKIHSRFTELTFRNCV